MTRETHTPTPWFIRYPLVVGLIKIDDIRGTRIVEVGTTCNSEPNRLANAKLIVAAVNERAALREALANAIAALAVAYDQATEAELERLPSGMTGEDVLKRARAVLALGEETKP